MSISSSACVAAEHCTNGEACIAARVLPEGKLTEEYLTSAQQSSSSTVMHRSGLHIAPLSDYHAWIIVDRWKSWASIHACVLQQLSQQWQTQMTGHLTHMLRVTPALMHTLQDLICSAAEVQMALGRPECLRSQGTATMAILIKLSGCQ